MKIVVNRCYGGFGISNFAVKELVKRNADCVESFTPKHYYGGNTRPVWADWEARWQSDLRQFIDIGDGYLASRIYSIIYKDGLLWDLKYGNEIRTDKDLIDVVESMGKDANGMCADLEVVEIPDGVNWEIDNYDGMETIDEVHRSW